MLLKMKDKVIELRDALPITLGDSRRLKREFNTKVEDLFSGDPDAVGNLLLVLLRKVDPELTQEHIDCIPLHVLKNVGDEIKESSTEVDRPTSAPSTVSPSTTDGQSAMLSDSQ